MTALAIIAAMTLASNLTVGHMLKEQESAGSGINVAGRQRMLSQRIAGLAAQATLGLAVQADLVQAIDQFELAHHELAHGDIGTRLDPGSIPELQEIYFDGPHSLDQSMGDFIRRARQVANTEPGSPELRRLAEDLFTAAREPLLTSLNAVVLIHQKISEARVQALQQVQFGSLIVTIITLLIEAAFIFRPMVIKIVRYTHALKKIAATDPLTGALNRRSFNDRAVVELSRASRYARSTCVMIIDADHFKTVNDRYGHAGGDAVLQALTASIAANLRPSDLLGRLGGEEFAVLLVETGLAGAMVAAERIRQSVAALTVESSDASIQFTISIGVTELGPEGTGLQRAMERADAALYEAKASGRNRVVLAKPFESSGTPIAVALQVA